MIKTYDTASNAFIEKVPKIYDATAGAWVEAPSVKTFDANQNAWIERLVLDNYFKELAFSFNNGGGYSVSTDKRMITFDFRSGSFGTDSASLVWEGKEVTDGVFIGEFATNNADLNPDVYFYHKGNQVLATKLRTQDNYLFGILCSGLTVDRIYVNIVPYRNCTFSLINPYFGKSLKFEIERS